MTKNGGRLLLILTSRDAQSAAQLAQASGLSPAETLRQLHRLVDRGFIIATDDTAITFYRLTPRAVRPDELDPHRRILLVESELVLREMLVEILEDEGYAVIAAAAPIDATALLERATFDLVITDGFSRQASAGFANTNAVLQGAGSTPVALFSAHTFELERAQAAGFRDLITKPFDLDALLRQVRVLVGR